MKAIGVIGSVDIGPWRMPQKAQTALLNQYADKENIQIEYIISEYVFADVFPNLQRRVQVDKPEAVIFVSVFQLPSSIANAVTFMDKLRGGSINFALEDISLQPGESCETLLNERMHFSDSNFIKKSNLALKSGV